MLIQEWSDQELAAVIDAYITMLNLEQKNIPYKKSEFNQKLRNTILAGRSKSSIEYRMQNISAVFEDLCMPRIRGYLPARNVGQRVFDKIRNHLKSAEIYDPNDYQPTADEQLWVTRAQSILRKPLGSAPPKGRSIPERIKSDQTTYVRDPLVRAWVLQQAGGYCEACSQPAPFKLPDNTPFLEIHHMTPLSEGGPDDVSNAIAACPNCHRQFHFGVDRDELRKLTYEKVSRLRTATA